MRLNLIPKDSAIQHYLKLARFMEAPYSYVVGCCISSISALLRRNIWFDIDESGVIFPNVSVLLIGPTGIGKDTAINMGYRRILKEFMPGHRITGITSEAIAGNLHGIAERGGEDPACGYILANELKQLFGGKDYQGGIIELLTHLLSDLDEYVHGTKHKPLIIPHPTIVLQAGSTEEWFHQLPEGALEGGFVPRCLIIHEPAQRTMIPLPKDYMDKDDREAKAKHLGLFWEGIDRLMEIYSRPREVYFDEEAKNFYSNWYCNRYKLLGPFAQGYAHRSRGHVVRLAMVMAATRGHAIIELCDVEFAVGWMLELIGNLEAVILPPTEEGRCVVAIKKSLPAKGKDLVQILRPKFSYNMVNKTLEILRATEEIAFRDGMWYNNNTTQKEAINAGV